MLTLCEKRASSSSSEVTVSHQAAPRLHQRKPPAVCNQTTSSTSRLMGAYSVGARHVDFRVFGLHKPSATIQSMDASLFWGWSVQHKGSPSPRCAYSRKEAEHANNAFAGIPAPVNDPPFISRSSEDVTR